MDQEEQRDHAEESQPHPDAGEAPGPDDRLRIELRWWNRDRNLFLPYLKYEVAEPFAQRSQAEWSGIVATHLPGDLPVGIYAFRLFNADALIAAGELNWDGRVATRREGASAP